MNKEKEASWMYIGIISIGLCTLGIFALTPNQKAPVIKNTNQKVDTIYVDRYHVDSTGKYLLRWDGDTVKLKPKYTNQKSK
jgi:hypothetical protein